MKMSSPAKVCYDVTMLVMTSLLLYTACEASFCPPACRCALVHGTGSPYQGASVGFSVDCSNLGLTDLPPNLDPRTSKLVLSHNQIRLIPSNYFARMPNISVILLNDNLVEDMEAGAFYGLHQLRTLDLRRNKLRQLGSKVFEQLSGADVCQNGGCQLILTENNLETIRSNAISWVKDLEVVIGRGDAALTVEPYAFYGIRAIPSIQISHVPMLTLKKGIFTSTQNIAKVHISHTTLAPLEKFTFEGLKKVQRIEFHNCVFSKIAPFAFSAVHYSQVSETLGPSYQGVVSEDTVVVQDGGGIVNITESRLHQLPTDCFRDTNLQEVMLVGNDIRTIHAYAFRGMMRLRTLSLVNNTMHLLPSESLGGLKDVDTVLLRGNDMNEIERDTFKRMEGVKHLHILVKASSNLTLGTHAFYGIRDVNLVEISGLPGTRTHLVLSPGVFDSVGGIGELRIAHLTIPVIEKDAFQGLSKVNTLRLLNCDVKRVDKMAFGSSTRRGYVQVVELGAGNQLPCDCDMHEILRDFSSRFTNFTISCFDESGTVHVITADSRHWPRICENHVSNTNAAHRSSTNYSYFLFPLFAVVQYYLEVTLRQGWSSIL